MLLCRKIRQGVPLLTPDISVTKVVILTLLAVTTIVLSAFGVFHYCLERGTRLAELQRDLKVHTLQLENSLPLPMWNFDYDQVDKIIESAMQDREIFAVAIEATDGSTRRAFVRDAAWRITATDQEIRGRELITRTAGISVYGRKIGTVQVFMTPSYLNESLRDFFLIVAAGIVTLDACLIFLLFHLLRKAVIRPLKRIEAYALSVGAGAPGGSSPGEECYFGELHNLRHAIVEMTVSLARAQEDQVQKLEERVRERTVELQETQHELVAAARHAGMAEIANNVLHNVGNVLNSVNVSAGVVTGKMCGSRLPGLLQAVELITEHQAELGEYLTRDEKGKLLPKYLEKLAQALTAEQQGVIEELSRLTKSVDHIKEIVATQQSYAGSSSIIEPVRIQDLVEDALRMNLGALTRHEVTVVKEFASVPVLPLDKARLLQILINLISNAKQSLDAVKQGSRRMTLALEFTKERLLRISVSDQGEGIAAENLSRIFNHGFTTRKNGHGFGLHSCALAAKEMGGTLSAESAGAGMGATFTLEIPVEAAGGTT